MILAIDNAVKTFGETRALDRVSVSVEAGSWVGLLGPNGAGKTTLVRSIAGRVVLDSGAVSFDFPDGSGANGLGVVPQEVAVYPTLTAKENLEVFASLYGLDRATTARRVDWALGWTGLADRAKDRADGFSGGMKRRLNLACSVLHEPSLLLLDEPTVGVDPQSRARIWEMLRELRARGTTLVLTTHQLDEAQSVCERIVIVDRGRVIADGTLAELIDQTIGRERRLGIQLDRAVPWSQDADIEFDPETNALSTRTSKTAETLAALAKRLEGSEAEILDVEIEAPTLQSVFLHLTGRELRE